MVSRHVAALACVCLVTLGGCGVADSQTGTSDERKQYGSGKLEDLVKGLNLPGGIVIDHPSSKMYWADAGFKNISRANLDGSKVEVLIKDLGAPWGIALDTKADKMYFTDGNAGTISRANLDGSKVEKLVSGIKVPWDIALDIKNSKMYFFSGDGVQSSTMDGKDAKLLTKVDDGIGIDVDLEAGKLYFASHWNSIQRSNLDGSKQETVIDKVVAPPWAIKLDKKNGMVYWADGEMGGDRIQRAKMDGGAGQKAEDLVMDLGLPQGLALDLDSREMYWTNLNTKKIQRAPMDGVKQADKGAVLQV